MADLINASATARGYDPYEIPTPFDNEPSEGDEISLANITAKEQARIQKYQEMWDFYLGIHWSLHMQQRTEEPVQTINFARKFVDRHNHMLVGKVPVFVPDDRVDEVEKERIDFVNAIWELADFDLFTDELTQTGGVCGDAFVHFAVVDSSDDPRFPFPHIRPEIIPPEYCFPTYSSGRIVGMLVIFPDDEYEEATGTEPLGGGRGVFYTESYYMDIVGGRFGPRIPHNYGIVPFAHYRNLVLANDRYGMSELMDFTNLNKDFNEKTTDISDIINYHAAPVTIIKGAKANTLARGFNKVWSGIPSDGDVYNLSLNDNLEASIAHLENLRTYMSEIGDIPEHAMGKALQMSNTSAAAITMLYWPMIEHRDKRRKPLGTFFKTSAFIILRIAEAEGMLGAPLDPIMSYRVRIKWGDTVPRNELLKLEEISQKRRLGGLTWMGMLKEMGMNEKQAEEHIQEFKDEWAELKRLGLLEWFEPATKLAEARGLGGSTPSQGAEESSRQAEVAAARNAQ